MVAVAVVAIVTNSITGVFPVVAVNTPLTAFDTDPPPLFDDV